jgi:hypothetical protein
MIAIAVATSVLAGAVTWAATLATLSRPRYEHLATSALAWHAIASTGFATGYLITAFAWSLA